MPDTCKTCRHWHNRQRDLGWSEHSGFCINPEVTRYSIQHGCRVAPAVLDAQKHVKFEAWDYGHGAPEKTGVLLRTDETFGCIFHETERPNAEVQHG